jgi:ActR/RegA family two-component response regulator
MIAELSRRHPTARAVVLTAFDNLTTAVMAIKLGAVDYLAKPVDADELSNALLASPAPCAASSMDLHDSDAREMGTHSAGLRTLRP